jgi:hypothetical protein
LGKERGARGFRRVVKTAEWGVKGNGKERGVRGLKIAVKGAEKESREMER